MQATSVAQEPALPTAAFASPHPTVPSSVSMRTSAMSKLSMRPKSETCWRSGEIGQCSHRASTREIFISNERQQCRRALLDEHAVEALGQQAAAVVDDELQLLG